MLGLVLGSRVYGLLIPFYTIGVGTTTNISCDGSLASFRLRVIGSWLQDRASKADILDSALNLEGL